MGVSHFERVLLRWAQAVRSGVSAGLHGGVQLSEVLRQLASADLPGQGAQVLGQIGRLPPLKHFHIQLIGEESHCAVHEVRDVPERLSLLLLVSFG